MVVIGIIAALILVVLAAAAGGAVLAAADRRRSAQLDAGLRAGIDEAIAHAVHEARREAAGERDAAVNAALQHAALLNREALGAQASAGQQDLAAKKELIEAELAQVRDELGRMSTIVAQLGERSASVEGQLRSHAELTQHLAVTTQSLREALSSSKARGQWGERLAEDVLRHAGFVEHVNYAKQVAVAGGRAIPDFTFFLPKGQVLYMDVKFPLAAYLRYLDAGTEAEREAHKAAFLRDVRLRVKELAAREYASGGAAVDHVLLFLPNEALSGFIHEHDPTLLDDALAAKVVLCSPLNLFVLLGVIRQAHDTFAVERTADDMLAVLGAFHAQWAKFSQAIDVVGKRLESAQRAFDDLNGTRRRQLERPLAKLEDLRQQRGLPIDDVALDEADVLELRELA